MQECPLISIVMPVYNVERYLQEAVGSILTQSYRNWELIAVNDASPDGSLLILRKLAQSDSRIKVISLVVNGGLPNARNVGMDEAQGKYIYFLDSDDALACDNALAELVRMAECENLDAILFDSIAVAEKEELQVLGDTLVPRHKTRHDKVLNGVVMYKELSKSHDQSVQVGRCFWRLERIREKGVRFFNDMIIMEDDLFYYEALLLMRRVRTINIAYHKYRIRDDSMSDRSANNNHSKELQAMIIEYVMRYKFLQQHAQELEQEIDYLYELQQEFYKVLYREYRFWRMRGSHLLNLRLPEYRHVMNKLNDDYGRRDLAVKVLFQLAAHKKTKLIGDENYRQVVEEVLQYGIEYELIYDKKFNVDVNLLVNKMRAAELTILCTCLFDNLKPLLNEFDLQENVDFVNGLMLI